MVNVFVIVAMLFSLFLGFCGLKVGVNYQGHITFIAKLYNNVVFIDASEKKEKWNNTWKFLSI